MPAPGTPVSPTLTTPRRCAPPEPPPSNRWARLSDRLPRPTLHQRDRTRQRAARSPPLSPPAISILETGAPKTVRAVEALEGEWPSRSSSSSSSSSLAASPITVPGGIDRISADLSAARRSSAGGMTPPTTTTISLPAARPAPRAARAAASGDRPPGAQPTTCTSAVDRLPRHLLGRGNSGPTSTSKPRSANADAITFCPRSWPSWPILATRIRGRRPSRLANPRRRPADRACPASSPISPLYTPAIAGSMPDGARSPSRARRRSLRRSRARAASTASSSRLFPSPVGGARTRSALERAPHLLRVALAPAGVRAWPPAPRAPRSCRSSAH